MSTVQLSKSCTLLTQPAIKLGLKQANLWLCLASYESYVFGHLQSVIFLAAKLRMQGTAQLIMVYQDCCAQFFCTERQHASSERSFNATVSMQRWMLLYRLGLRRYCRMHSGTLGVVQQKPQHGQKGEVSGRNHSSWCACCISSDS